MDCKDEAVWRSWLLPAEEAENPAAVVKLRSVVNIIDRISREFDGQDIVITSHRRPATGKPSYHWRGQAVDLRVHGRTERFRTALLLLLRGLRRLDPQIQYNPHDDLHTSTDPDVHKHDHVHLEVDDGALKGVTHG